MTADLRRSGAGEATAARREQLATACALAISLAAAIGAVWISARVYERLPHLEDELAYLWEAKVMAQGKMWLASPHEPRSFLVPFVVDYEGRRFGKYPPGWPAALALADRAGDIWLVNPFLTGASIWLIFRLGSKIAGPGVGVLAAALAAFSPVLLVLAGTLMPHIFTLFLTLAFTLAWIDLWSKSRESGKAPPAWLLVSVAGLSLGLLGLTRPLTALGVCLPFAVHGLIVALRRGPAARMRLAAIAALAIGVTLLLALWQAALTGDAGLNPYTLWWPYDRVGFGPDFGRAESGHNLGLALLNAQLSLAIAQTDLFGWPYASWIFVPFGILALRRRWGAWLEAGSIPALVGVYLFYWAGTPRYYFEALPAAAILSAAGIAWLAGWEASRKSWGMAVRRAGIAALVLILGVLNGVFYLPTRLAVMRGLYGISAAKRDAFAAHAPRHALVLVHPYESWTDYGTLLTLTPPFCDCDLILLYSRGPVRDSRAAADFPDHEVYHYYADEPGVFYPEAGWP